MIENPNFQLAHLIQAAPRIILTETIEELS